MGYIFDVGNGDLLFLKGQEFYPVRDSMPWPASEFEMVKSADGRIDIGIFSTGEPLKPVDIIRVDEIGHDLAWAQEDRVVRGDLRRFANSLRTPASPDA